MNETIVTDTFALNWLKVALKGTKHPQVSSFGAQVAEIMHLVWDGIYHVEHEVIRADWSDDRLVTLVIPGELSTFDSDLLTQLVMLAHDRAIRLSIHGVGPRYLRLRFSLRQRDGDWYNRHPTLEEAAAAIRRRHEQQ